MSVENVVNHKEEFLNQIYEELSKWLDESVLNKDIVFEYDKMKLEQIKSLNKLCDIDFKRFFNQVYNEDGYMNDARKIARIASLYDYNMAIASYSDSEINLFVEVTSDIPPEEYIQYDNSMIPLFSNREVAQNIMVLYPEFEEQVSYIKAYMDGCDIMMESHVR